MPFDGYTLEEFEEFYGYKPYCYFEGHMVFDDDIVWFENGKIDINPEKYLIDQIANDGYIDGTNPFESEDERFAREQREAEERYKRYRENMKRNGFI